MSLTGYIVIQLGKHIIMFALLMPLMIILDGLSIYSQHYMDNIDIITGVMTGTLSKIIIFLKNEQK